MKAVRLHKFHSMPVIDEVPEPRITGPFDVATILVSIYAFISVIGWEFSYRPAARK